MDEFLPCNRDSHIEIMTYLAAEAGRLFVCLVPVYAAAEEFQAWYV